MFKDITPVSAIEWGCARQAVVSRSIHARCDPGKSASPVCVIHSGRPGKMVVVDTGMIAPVGGISEPLVSRGHVRARGRPPVTASTILNGPTSFIAEANMDGNVMVRRFRAAIQQGDVMMVLAARDRLTPTRSVVLDSRGNHCRGGGHQHARVSRTAIPVRSAHLAPDQ